METNKFRYEKKRGSTEPLFFYGVNIQTTSVRETYTLKGFDFVCVGGGEPPMTYNTISRELLNNAYNLRFNFVSKQSKEIIKETVFAD